jgi:low temperature requirement protein LtrA
VNAPALNAEDTRVSPLELFFDLVFVFALTQVTVLMAEDLGAESLLRGVLVLGLLWASWAGYAWLCNVVSADGVRTVLLTSMAAMLALALAIPEAFHDRPGGLHGPLLVAVCYLVFRVVHLAMYALASRHDAEERRQLLAYTPFVLAGTALLLVAAATDGRLQTLLWLAALGADYVGTLVGGAEGWQLRSPGHFAERHGLIVIVALGESIVAIGMAVRHQPLTGPVLVGSLLGLVVSTSLWWVYFGGDSADAERALHTEPAATRTRLARDAFSLLHLPLLVGVVLTALGLKTVLQDVDEPLAGAALAAMHGGVLLFLLGHAAFRWRIAHDVAPARLVAAVGVAATWAAGPHLPALWSLVTLAAVLAALVTRETVGSGR